MKDFSRRTFLIASFVFIASLVSAQPENLNDLSLNQLKKFGKSAARAGDVNTAIYFYEKYHDSRKNNQDVNYTLAELHRTARNYERAKDLYRQVYNQSASKYPLAQFYYAQMLKSTGNYDEATDEFTDFRKNFRGNKDERAYSRMVRIEIEGCDSAKKIMQYPLNVSIENINSTVNGPHIELSPIPVDDSTFIMLPFALIP